jgi:aryl-alcohol dehydrogenase-like predicted oxidoreductase
MEYATLGNTGLLVSKLCFGTMTFGDGRGLFKAISTVDQAGPMNWSRPRLTAASTSLIRRTITVRDHVNGTS